MKLASSIIHISCTLELMLLFLTGRIKLDPLLLACLSEVGSQWLYLLRFSPSWEASPDSFSISRGEAVKTLATLDNPFFLKVLSEECGLTTTKCLGINTSLVLDLISLLTLPENWMLGPYLHPILPRTPSPETHHSFALRISSLSAWFWHRDTQWHLSLGNPTKYSAAVRHTTLSPVTRTVAAPQLCGLQISIPQPARIRDSRQGNKLAGRV